MNDQQTGYLFYVIIVYNTWCTSSMKLIIKELTTFPTCSLQTSKEILFYFIFKDYI
jgi:hypothetical protein